MASEPIHGNRIGKLTTPLGEDVLLLTRFDGTETLSELFEFDVHAIASRDDIDFDELLGRHCTVTLDTISGGKRHFDGICVAGRNVGVDEGMFSYALRLSPWLWMLTKRVNNKIFKDVDVLSIVAEVFSDHPDAEFRQNTTSSYPVLEYTVQTRESDFEFVTRLLARFGISFYFTHESGKHTLVLCDGPAGYGTIPEGEREYHPLTEQNRRDTEHFSTWTALREFTSGRVETLDYNFKKPTQSMSGNQTGDGNHSNSELEVFDYPNKHLEKGEGQDLAEMRVNQLRAADFNYEATGNVLSLETGMTVSLTKHPIQRMNNEYLAIEAVHSFVTESFHSGTGHVGEGDSYVGSFRFVEASRPYSPPRVIADPSIHGVQTATVVGDGEIDVDEIGRIMVRFHWDRDGRNSMRCRIAQVWAGAKWGGVFFPRVGMEVLVEFEEGDPDRPVVVGCLYNGDNEHPFDLPGDKNINGWKSNSTEGGGGYNELVFDDTKGNELLRQHAQFDMETKVLHDERRNVDNDQSEGIGNDREQSITRNDRLEIGGSRTQRIGYGQSGPGSSTLNVAKVLHLEADQKIVLQCGASKITLTPSAIDVETVNLSTKDTKSDRQSAALAVIKAGLVKIN